MLYFGFHCCDILQGDLEQASVAQQFHMPSKLQWSRCSFSSFSGNPFTGYIAKDIKLKLDDKTLNLAESISIKFSLKSLITGKPSIGNIAVASVKIATDDLARLLDLFPAGGGGKENISVDEVTLNDVQIFGKRRIYIEGAHSR